MNKDKEYDSIELFADDMFPNDGPHKTVVMNQKEYKEYMLWKKRTNGVLYL